VKEDMFNGLLKVKDTPNPKFYPHITITHILIELTENARFNVKK